MTAVLQELSEKLAKRQPCGWEHVAQLRTLLFEYPGETKRPRSAAAASRTAPKAPRTHLRAKSTAKASPPLPKQEIPKTLSLQQRHIIATETVNYALAILGTTTSASPEIRDATKSGKEVNAATATKSHPRPNATLSNLKENLSQKSAPDRIEIAEAVNYNVAATAELGHEALRFLQTPESLDFSKSSSSNHKQLIGGILAFCAKVMTLDLQDIATKQFELLHALLENVQNQDRQARTAHTKTRLAKRHHSSDTNLPALLDFGAANLRDAALLDHIFSYQMLVLRLIASDADAAVLEAVLPHLDCANRNSIINVLLYRSRDKNAVERVALQMQTTSKILAHCANRMARDAAVNSSAAGLSFQLQALALCARMAWSKMKDHKKNTDKDIVSPLVSSLSTYVILTRDDAHQKLSLAQSVCHGMENFAAQNSSLNEPRLTHSRDLQLYLACLTYDSGDIREAQQTIEDFLSSNVHATNDKPSDPLYFMAVSRLGRRAFASNDTAQETEDTWDYLRMASEALRDAIHDADVGFEVTLREAVLLRNGAYDYIRKFASSSYSANASIKVHCALCYDILSHFNLLLLRNLSLGMQRADGGISKSLEARQILVLRIVKQSLEASINVTRLSFRHDLLSNDSLTLMLKTCRRLVQDLVQDENLAARSEILDTAVLKALLVDLTKLHFQVVRSGSQAKAELAAGLKSIQYGLDLSSAFEADEKREAQLYLAYYRKGRILLKMHQDRLACESFSVCITECIEYGIVQEAADLLDNSPLQTVLNSSSEMQILNSAIKALLELQVKDSSYSPNVNLKDHGKRTQALLLECRLYILMDWSSKHIAKANLSNLIQPTVKSLLDCYEKPTHPLRYIFARGRALQLFIDFGMTVDEEMLEIDVSVDELGFSDDNGLANYHEHIMATFQASRGMCNPTQNGHSLATALDVWIRVLTSCNSWKDIVAHIYDVDLLSSQLEAMSGCLEMLGHDDDRARCLAVMACLRVKSDSTDVMGKADSLALVSQALSAVDLTSEAELWLKAATSQMQNATDRGPPTLIQLTAHAEWQLATNDLGKSHHNIQQLIKRLENANPDLDDAFPESSAGLLPRKARRMMAAANVFAICSTASLANGEIFDSLVLGRRSASLLEHVWRSVESHHGVEANDVDESTNSVDGLARRLSRMSISPKRSSGANPKLPKVPGPAFWTLSRRLFRALMHMSLVSRYVGSLTGAIAANDQARKIAEATGSASLQVEVLTDKAQLAWRSGLEDEAKECFHQIESVLAQSTVPNRFRASYLIALGEFHRHRKHWRSEQDAYSRVESLLDEPPDSVKTKELGEMLQICGYAKDLDEHDSRNSSDDIKPSQAGTRGTSQVRQTGRKASTHKRNQSKPAIPPVAIISHTKRIKGQSRAVLIQRVESMLKQSNLAAAGKFLQSLGEDCSAPGSQQMYKLLKAKVLLQDALANMAAHAVYGMLPESTLSVPNIPLPTQQVSSPYLAMAVEETSGRHRRQSSQAISSARAEIQQIFSLAMEAATSMDSQSGFWNTNALSRRYEIVAACSILFSFAGVVRSRQQTSPLQLASHLDYFQSEMTLREHMFIEAEQSNKLAVTSTAWPLAKSLEASAEALTLSDSGDDLMQLLPKNWIVVSLNLRENQEHLYLTRYTAQTTPFVLRLPLNRQTGDELDEETFSLDQAREELRDIIESSDNMVHKGRDAPQEMKVKGAKTQWWAEREELDARLRSLLINMENIWFGGFRGIFSVRETSDAALARFRETFEAILVRHLPSRQASSKRGKTEHVSLDTSVLELFVGLMTRSEDGVADLDEALNDLLYFVVDILQYNGEANAYDEIDFDAIIVEVQDALLDFRDGLSEGSAYARKKKQIVLVLDKQLHLFPWESMPCLEGRSVTRVPSIKDIVDRIKLMQAQSYVDGVQVSRQTGTYMLNPSKDLPRTQKRFERPLSTLFANGWSAHVGRPVTEEEFEKALSRGSSQFSRNIMMYIGHGSGAQYIRGKAIRRLRPHCNAALLFGCSSVKLKEAGEFEEYGTPKTYLAAGAPAVLGSLWDVTDGDVDKFAAAVLEGWGLIAAGSIEADDQQQKGRAKVKRKANTGAVRSARRSIEEKVSLSDAVSKGKEHCYLKYLNGAAMVVYGVPLYLD